MQKQLKIGIIQNAPLTADFSNNLRHIVQGYRECLDHGASLVVAPATALCGPEPQGLAERRSFQRQTQAALHALSQELGDTPLVLGAYADIFPYDDADDFSEEPPTTELAPYILSNNEVSQLEEDETIELNGSNILVDINDEYTETTEEADLLIHLRTAPWYAGAPAEDEEDGLWEAALVDTPVISVRHTGCCGGNLYAGGSAVYSPKGHTIARLPLFESCNKVVKLTPSTRAKALPTEEEQLCTAIEYGIRNTVHQYGYSGVCINAAARNADLLAALCSEALGSSNVTLLTTESAPPVQIPGVRKHAQKLAPLLQQAEALVPAASAALRARLTAAAQFSYAEAEGLLYLCPLTRSEFLLGDFSLYGESCGHFAPLGNLYEMDLYKLKTHLREKYTELFGTLSEPQLPATDRILHELADRNISATELLNNHVCPFSEEEVRRVQRKHIAAALKNTQVPTVLHADKLSERISLPACHRMND